MDEASAITKEKLPFPIRDMVGCRWAAFSVSSISDAEVVSFGFSCDWKAITTSPCSDTVGLISESMLDLASFAVLGARKNDHEIERVWLER